MKPKLGSMREAISNIYQFLIKDEELLRLLHYYPKDSKYLSPLDDSLPDILGKDDSWEKIDERIMLAEKTHDLEANPLCRIYISLGRRRPVFNNYLITTQEVNISVFVHEDYNSDMRIELISDRINELIALKRIAGYGLLEYAGGNPRDAPRQYERYVHTYVFTGKKG